MKAACDHTAFNTERQGRGERKKSFSLLLQLKMIGAGFGWSYVPRSNVAQYQTPGTRVLLLVTAPKVLWDITVPEHFPALISVLHFAFIFPSALAYRNADQSEQSCLANRLTGRIILANTGGGEGSSLSRAVQVLPDGNPAQPANRA